MIISWTSLCQIGALMIAAGVLFACPRVSLAENSLPLAHDLVDDAKTVERTGIPLIVMVSLTGCPHCELVRRTYLLPLLRDTTATHKPLIRQVEINSQDMLRDFSGRTITNAEFATRYKIKIAPVVMFLDAKGQMLTDSLVGAMIPEFYGAYLDAALVDAKAKLQNRSRPKLAKRAS